jgi:DNA polymerase sigma
MTKLNDAFVNLTVITFRLLDFYGNYFNPRSTGISVRTRQYFFRSQGAHDSLQAGKFDPIWVEDPMNVNNNVGRNAFRIFQVQRAFSDAHRALVASLEWDINSTNEFDDDGEYPLLKCLLQNEDVFFSIEDNPISR